MTERAASCAVHAAALLAPSATVRPCPGRLRVARPLHGRPGPAEAPSATRRRLHRRRRQPGARHRQRGAAAARARARRGGARQASACRRRAVLRAQVLSALIDERVQVTNARDSGVKRRRGRDRPGRAERRGAEPVDDRRSCASSCAGGHRYAQFRANRARPDAGRARARTRGDGTHPGQRCRDRRSCSSEQAAAAAGVAPQLNIAQILVTVPEGASRGRSRRARRPGPRRRWRGRGPASLRQRSRGSVRRRQPRRRRRDRPAPGRPAAGPVRRARCADCAAATWRRRRCAAGAGFHVLKLVERREGRHSPVPADPRAPHPAAPVGAAERRTPAMRAAGRLQAAASKAARPTSSSWRARTREDGSAAQGGDLGWASPGTVRARVRGSDEPRWQPGGMSRPGGVALRRAPDPGARAARGHARPKQQREQARNVLREQKFEDAYDEWAAGPARPRLRRDARAAARAAAARRCADAAHRRASASASTSWPTRRSSMRSCARSIRGRARRWSRSARASAR